MHINKRDSAERGGGIVDTIKCQNKILTHIRFLKNATIAASMLIVAGCNDNATCGDPDTTIELRSNPIAFEDPDLSTHEQIVQIARRIVYSMFYDNDTKGDTRSAQEKLEVEARIIDAVIIYLHRGEMEEAWANNVWKAFSHEDVPITMHTKRLDYIIQCHLKDSLSIKNGIEELKEEYDNGEFEVEDEELIGGDKKMRTHFVRP